MSQELSYQELYEKYRDLELRVTRFSATQQELINTRDVLDHELVVYKRLNSYISKAIRVRGLSELMTLIAESIVDIFELQIGFVQLIEYGIEGQINEEIFFEGIAKTDHSKFLRYITELENIHITSGEIKVFDSTEIKTYFKESELNYCLLSKPLAVGSVHRMVIAAALDNRNAPSYSQADQRKQTLFKIFIRQTETLVTNLLNFDRIRSQMKVIQSSDLELRKLSLIATKTNNAVIITDNYGRIEWVNEAFSKSTGYLFEEVLGKKPKDFLQVRDERTRFAREKLAEALSKKEFIEVEIINLTKTNEEYIIQLQITPVFNQEKEIINFIAIQKDITSEFIHRKELERINSRMDKITNGSNIGMWEFDLVKENSMWNSVLYDVYEVDKNVDNRLQVWREALHPEDRERVLNEINMIRNGQVQGSDFEYRILVGSEKQHLKYVRTIAFLEEFADNRLNRILGSTVDITPNKNFENEIIEKNNELVKINKELDQFVYSVSHDLRSPLLSVKGLVSLLQIPEEDVESRSYIDMINKSINRLDNSILEILNYSRNARLEVVNTEFDVVTMIKDIFDDLSHLDENLELTVDSEGESKVNMDRYRVEILLKNLITNGVKYRRKEADPPFVHVKVKNNYQSLIIEIQDNGEGIPDSLQEKVFEMFYRASKTSQGTGLGLYLCKEIISKLEGELKMKSFVNQGTIITLTIPNYI